MFNFSYLLINLIHMSLSIFMMTSIYSYDVGTKFVKHTQIRSDTGDTDRYRT